MAVVILMWVSIIRNVLFLTSDLPVIAVRPYGLVTLPIGVSSTAFVDNKNN